MPQAAKQRSSAAKKPSPAVGAHHRNAVIAQIVLMIVTLATLWPVCTNDFTTWDDNLNVSQNPRLNPVTLDGVLYFWAHPYEAEYIPLSYTVWGGLASIAQVTPDASAIRLNPYIFHSANLLLHLAAVMATFALLRLLTKSEWPGAMGALLFAIHPIQVEPVAWVTGLKDVLCGALSVAALWQYVLFAQPVTDAPSRSDHLPPQSDRARAIHYAAATLAFILAMLAKPSAVTVPLAALLIDRLFLGRSWRQIATALGPWLILSAAFAIVALAAHKVVDPSNSGTIWSRPLLAGAAWAFYLYKLVWPARLAVIYHYSPGVLFAGRWIWFAWMVPVAVAIVLWAYRKRWPWLLGCAGLSLIAILPVSGLTPFQFERFSLVADRYFYFAMIGPALALSFALASARTGRVAAIFCVIALSALAVRSCLQTAYWSDTVSLFSHELSVNPYSEAAYNSLAERAVMDKDPQRAEQLARQAVHLDPAFGEAYITLGSALSSQGRKDEALIVYRRACELRPDNAVALNDLAGVLADRGRIDEAMPLCKRALQSDPFFAPAHRNMAVMLAHQNRFADALQEAQLAVQLDPQTAENQMTLAFLQAATGQRDASIERLRQLLTLHPDFIPAQRLLGELSRPPQ